MADDVTQISAFWDSRLANLTARAREVQSVALPAAAEAVRQAQAALGRVMAAADAAAQQAEAARNALARVAMPADTASLEDAWQEARRLRAQAEVEAEAARRSLAVAQARAVTLQAEAAHLAEEISLAETRAKAARPRTARLEALKTGLQSADFQAGQAGAAGLLAEGLLARQKLEALVPPRMLAVVAARMARDEAALSALARAGDAVRDAVERSDRALDAMAQAGEALVAGAGALTAAAARQFAAWKALVPRGPGSPVSADSHALLVDRAGRNAARWAALAAAEAALAEVDKAEAELAARELAWPEPGAAGHSPDGPDTTAERAALAAKRAAYAPDAADLRPVLEALVHLPDAWLEALRHHRRLMRELGALGQPLGAADAAAAATALSAATGAHAAALSLAAEVRDGAAKWAREIEERRLRADALIRLTEARPMARPGGLAP